jgi:hypothetical protein
MSGFFDTNILIDFLNGVAEAQVALAPFARRCIGRITWMEVMAGVIAARPGWRGQGVWSASG